MWIVMSGGRFGAQRAFETNAVDLADEAAAEAEATRRNEIERAAGRDEDDVLWFAINQPTMEELMAMMKRG